MKFLELKDLKNENKLKNVICYLTVDQNYNSIFSEFKKYQKCPIFGCSSSLGVFTPNGFKRGAFFLGFEESDNIEMYSVIKMSGELTCSNAIKMAADEIKRNFGIPDLLFMHATPGFEEDILINLKKELNAPIYGGSAADDDLSSKWFIFKENLKIRTGFLLIAIKYKNISGSFIGGYLKSQYSGIITKSNKRILYEIDNKPAAEVYNKWTNGLFNNFINNEGNILKESSLHPLAIVIGKVIGIDSFLLIHPHQIISKDKSITLFAEVKEGERIYLMNGNENVLIKKARDVAHKSIIGKSNIKGALFIYYGGVTATIINNVNEVINEYKKGINSNNFIGVATFGEQGYFKSINESKHGTLMISSISF
jgi:hypothetical protein